MYVLLALYLTTNSLVLAFVVGHIESAGHRRCSESSFMSKPFSMSLTSRSRSTIDESRLYMGMKVHIRIVGRKSSEAWLEEGVEMYETRLRPSNVEVETTWHKDNAALVKGVEADRSKNYKVVCLDPQGKQTSSEAFCHNLYEWLEDGGSRLSFIIGGAEGLPSELKYPSFSSNGKQNSPPPLISLSYLTFTHQFGKKLGLTCW
jgi:23S rRNA (pseudouridine1915-N3)-methyltransferase